MASDGKKPKNSSAQNQGDPAEAHVDKIKLVEFLRGTNKEVPAQLRGLLKINEDGTWEVLDGTWIGQLKHAFDFKVEKNQDQWIKILGQTFTRKQRQLTWDQVGCIFEYDLKIRKRKGGNENKPSKKGKPTGSFDTSSSGTGAHDSN